MLRSWFSNFIYFAPSRIAAGQPAIAALENGGFSAAIFVLKSNMFKTENWYMTDRQKEFIKLNKRYLNLIYKKAQCKIAGETPSEDLMNEIADVRRKVRLISRALE